jgi:hypothetical protein
VRQRTLAECLNKRRRAIHEADSDEEEGGGVSANDMRGSSSRAIHVAHCVHPDVLHPPRQLQVPTTAAATSAAAAATAAATATTPASSASAVAVAPPAVPAPDVLAAACHLFYSWCRLATTGWSGGKATGETETEGTAKEIETKR